MSKARFLALAAVMAAAACSPKQFETDPVTLDSPQGPVVCQLYTKTRLDWDRAVTHPDAMPVETADAMCEAEGVRRMKS